MKKCLSCLLSALFLFGAFLLLPAFAEASGTDYYVSTLGNDGNPGTQEAPWRSLAKISETTFGAGDAIHLKRGEVFEGTVTLHGDGSNGSITLTAYGNGERPYIKGPRDNASSCVTLAPDAQGWKLSGLEIGSSFNGINLQIGGAAGNDGYFIEDCYIHDCNNAPSTLPFGHGIILKGVNAGKNEASNITVKNCIFKGNDREFFPDNLTNGIFLTNVLIDGCTITGSGYNSVYHTCATNFDIINSLWLDNGGGSIPVGNTCIISGELTGGKDCNMVSGNEFGFMKDPGGADGSAYDFEIDTDGISFVNNFVHNCYGQAVMIMPNAVCKDIRIEDNIFSKNLTETTRHKGELALYGGGTGTVANNVFQLRFTNLFRLPKMIDGDAKGLEIRGNCCKQTQRMTETPKCTFDETANTATLSGAKDAALYYTTDGSVPTKESKLYAGETIPVTQTTVLNCKAFADGELPSISCSKLLTPGSAATDITPQRDTIFGTNYLSSFINWLLYIVCFGWIWM